MKQFKFLTCGLLASAGLLAITPSCHADYIVDEGASMITAQTESVNEGHSNYSLQGGATAYLDGTVSTNTSYTAKGGKVGTNGNSGGVAGRTWRAAVTSQYNWVGEGEVGPPYTFRFFPGYVGSASARGTGEYSTSLKITGSSGGTRRPPSPDSPQDDWDIGGGGVDYTFASNGNIDGPDGNFGTAEGDMRSYPSVGRSGFTVTTDLSLTGTVRAITLGSTASLDEICDLYIDISLDN